jgi:hypothetical protein
MKPTQNPGALLGAFTPPAARYNGVVVTMTTVRRP